jgi:hypothetical protein
LGFGRIPQALGEPGARLGAEEFQGIEVVNHRDSR